MVERIDHLARMRGEPEPESAPDDPDAPQVSPALIAYLERVFPGPSDPVPANDVPAVLLLVNMNALRVGQLNVINHLKSLVRGA